MRTTRFLLSASILFGAIKLSAQTNTNTVQGANDNTKGTENVIIGTNAGAASDLNYQCVFIGNNAGMKTERVSSTDDGDWNTFVGYDSGKENVTGAGNAFFGYGSGINNTSGGSNTFLGMYSGFNNLDGYLNVFVGKSVGQANTSGYKNTFIGFAAGEGNNTGSHNIFLGNEAGYGNTSGDNNICIGRSGFALGSAIDNTFIGKFVANSCTGSRNLAIGFQSGEYLTTGSNNVFVGYVRVNNAAATGTTIGYDTADTIIMSDGGGNQRFIIDDNGYAGIGLPLYNIPQNRLVLGTGNSGTTGLRFSSIPTAITNPGTAVLSVNSSGDVILVNDAGGSGGLTSLTAGTNITLTPSGSPVTSYTIAATDTSLYNTNGTLGADRTVATGNNNLFFDTTQTGGATKGKVYIGTSASYPTTSGNYKLYVEGGILTEKVKVATRSSGNWADYVFNADYKLRPLSEVESFIKTNKHLPNIPSAETLVKEGLDLADMQAKQMEKIEELTLYLIEQKKEIDVLKAQVKALTENINPKNN